ncbi:dynein regulatory complex subunit 7 [Trichomycterus rosablanca]|uniref:dynein regulatory complex subunit 7 n=1 Tax=Trichomycterus rosablanca TaxID=2290929 RepID=UPI002F355BD6
MEVIQEVKSETEEAEQERGDMDEDKDEGEEDEALRDLRELEQTLSGMHIDPSAPHMLEHKREVDVSEWPASYRGNSTQEKLLIAMAENFRCQYAHLYPDRKQLLLCPVNECGVQKFVSTTVRPTLLPYAEFYHWQGCASFVSDFLSLMRLDPPFDPPKQLRSPTCVLRTQRGTCFDSSTLLCSLLLGAGYNAYCVSGYAIKEMCLLQHDRQECPLLKPSTQEKLVEQKLQVKKYSVKPSRDLRSKFEQQQEERKEEERRSELLSKQQEAERLQEEKERPPSDPLLGLRVHSWVLVLSGNREVPENFFIDPLSGQSYSTSSENFLGIENIWNHQNYWVNMQDCRFGCAEMTYDLGDAVKWEYMLCGASSQSLLLIPDMEQQDDEEDEETEEPKVFEMPPSWVMKIQISQEDMESRCPGGMKLIQYRKATVEKFAPYLLQDGLVTRLTTYNDLECTRANMVTEWYKHRHDHLERRELNKSTSITIESFTPGRSSALKSHKYVTLVLETERQMEFYSNARADGLASRVETEADMTETFENRPDFLYYRHVVYGGVSDSGKTPKQDQRPIQKVVEKFHRDRSKPASENIAERVFVISEDHIQVTYHLEDNRIIPAWHDFVKPRDTGNSQTLYAFTPEMVSSFQVNPLEKPYKNLFLYETLMALMEEERRVITNIRDSKKEIRDILDVRQQEESAIKLQVSIYDTARNEKARRHREELERLAEEARLSKEDEELDVLAPFLVQLGNPKSLTKQQALQLRTDCLAELKQRLICRANLIQTRFEKETHELQQKQQWYQQNQLAMSKENEEEYSAYCSDAMFRINMLKLRLNRHKDRAPQMYLALDEKLRRDPRLSQHLL